MPTGVVTEIDEDRGLGTIRDADGTTFLFHVVEIADGTRSIDLGQSVVFDLLPKFGTIEAGQVRKI